MYLHEYIFIYIGFGFLCKLCVFAFIFTEHTCIFETKPRQSRVPLWSLTESTFQQIRVFATKGRYLCNRGPKSNLFGLVWGFKG